MKTQLSSINDLKLNEMIRENTPSDIKKRLKIEKLKDSKLNFKSIK